MFGRRHALGLATIATLASARSAEAWSASGEPVVVETRVQGGGVASQLLGSCTRGAEHAEPPQGQGATLAFCPICGCAIRPQRSRS